MEVMEKEDGVRGMGMNHSTIVNVNPIPQIGRAHV